MSRSLPRPLAEIRADAERHLAITEAGGATDHSLAASFARDGHLHYPDGVHGCGPITAQKADGYPPPRDATPVEPQEGERFPHESAAECIAADCGTCAPNPPQERERGSLEEALPGDYGLELDEPGATQA